MSRPTTQLTMDPMCQVSQLRVEKDAMDKVMSTVPNAALTFDRLTGLLLQPTPDSLLQPVLVDDVDPGIVDLGQHVLSVATDAQPRLQL